MQTPQSSSDSVASPPEQKALISQRKTDHINLCASGEVEFRGKGTLLDDLQLIHDALPDRHVDAIDLRTPLLGKVLAAPTDSPVMQGKISIDQAVRALEGTLTLPHAGPAIEVVDRAGLARLKIEESLAPAWFKPTFDVKG